MGIGLNGEQINQIVMREGAAVEEPIRRFVIKIIEKNNEQLEEDIRRLIQRIIREA